MPDFIRIARQIEDYPGQFVVRIGEDEDLQNTKHQTPSTRETSSSKLQTLAPRSWN
jgi:hypothetical protein